MLIVDSNDTDWVGSGWRRGGFDRRRRAVSRLVVLVGDVQRGEEIRQKPQDVDDC